MGLQDIDLNELAENVHGRSKGNKSKNMVYDLETGKWLTLAVDEPIPTDGVVSNQMTDEGFAQ